jgi:flagellar protein FlbT
MEPPRRRGYPPPSSIINDDAAILGLEIARCSMPLRFDLGPFEKLYIGKSVLTNSPGRAYFVLEGETPVLRGREVLAPELATTSLEKLYSCMQKIYLEETFADHQGSYLALMLAALKEQPASDSELREVDALMLSGHRYRALKRLKKLIGPDAFVAEKRESQNYRPRAEAGSRG